MAKSGRKFKFHGAFGTKKKAAAKERQTKGAFIRKVKIGTARRRGKKYAVKWQTRWLVLTKR